jgi:hypothetical protein
VLRDRDEYATRSGCCPRHLRKDDFVILDVLEDVECSDDVELVLERKAPRIQLKKRNLRQPRAGNLDPSRRQLPSGDI